MKKSTVFADPATGSLIFRSPIKTAYCIFRTKADRRCRNLTGWALAIEQDRFPCCETHFTSLKRGLTLHPAE